MCVEREECGSLRECPHIRSDVWGTRHEFASYKLLATENLEGGDAFFDDEAVYVDVEGDA
jgi:hypothetical protein